MEILVRGIVEAFRIVFSGDAEVASIALLSIRVSCSAVALAVVLGVPVGAVLAWGRFRGRRAILASVNALMGLPPVVAGLLVVMLLWRGGVLEGLGWLYTPSGMVLAQTIIALPIVAGLSASAYQQQSDRLRLQLLALGASRLQAWWLLTYEARLALLAAVMAALGRVLA
ncbi:MAG TPA: ABC transporter permease subunit, partial [Proteobacteria bacterium]|nr:ABC transporter permease subunit [Pseudomonadota bacterium]